MKKFVGLCLCLSIIIFVGCPMKDAKKRAPGVTTSEPQHDPGGSCCPADAAKTDAPKKLDAEFVNIAADIKSLVGDLTGKSNEVMDVLIGFKQKRAFDPAKNAAQKPKLFVSLPEDLFNPDGMTISDATGTLFLAVPNFSMRTDNSGPKLKPGALVKFNPDGSAEKILTFEDVEGIQIDTKQIGPMGIDFGPDGNLYVCDNQYFFDANNKSRVLRVIMDGDKPTGEVQVVVDGIKLANAILWNGDNMFVTDTFLDLDGDFGSGCLWKFSKDEILAAGKDGKGPVKVNPIKKMGDDSHCITIQQVKKIPGGGNAGFDGLTCDANGIMYSGNFGNGEIYRIEMNGSDLPKVEVIHPAGE
ncbi:MAG: SMP-30/gluconolactonase/LRE family protein, partial [Thermoguttaceae bacterium]